LHRAWSVCMSVCMSVRMSHSHSCTLLKPLDGMRCYSAGTLVCSQATLCKTGAPVPPREGEIWGRIPQFAAMPPVAKLLWPLFYRKSKNRLYLSGVRRYYYYCYYYYYCCYYYCLCYYYSYYCKMFNHGLRLFISRELFERVEH